MTTYTIEREMFYSKELREFIEIESPKISRTFENKFNHEKAAITKMIEHGIFLVGRRNGEIRGIHVSWLVKSPLDTETKLLQQQIFYVKPDSGRMTYYLFKKFIDIGRSEANHIITMLTRHTNIKPETLIKYGFKEIEVLYRLEIK
jgi:hypothetical protein